MREIASDHHRVACHVIAAVHTLPHCSTNNVILEHRDRNVVQVSTKRSKRWHKGGGDFRIRRRQSLLLTCSKQRGESGVWRLDQFEVMVKMIVRGTGAESSEGVVQSSFPHVLQVATWGPTSAPNSRMIFEAVTRRYRCRGRGWDSSGMHTRAVGSEETRGGETRESGR